MTIEALIEKLEAAEAGNRDLDGHINLALGIAERTKRPYASTIGGRFFATENYTTSIDAATALIANTLPKSGYGCGKRWDALDPTPDELAYSWIRVGSETYEVDAPTPALALCLALLKALQASPHKGAEE